jgi:hypothetical protein
VVKSKNGDEIMKKTMNKVLCGILAGVSVFGSAAMLGGCTTNHPEVEMQIAFDGKTYTLEYTLYRKFAPNTVAHFLQLAENGYYDGLCVHDYADNKLYSVYNYVEEVEVKRSFPNAVTITIVEAEPFSVIEEADGFTLVSAGGKVLERGLEEVPHGMLSVRGLSTITSTENDIKRTDLMLKIIGTMKKLEMNGYNFLDLSDTLEIVMIYDNRVKLVIGNELELEYKLQFADNVISEKLSKTGYQLVDASSPGEIMTKEMTVSPWDSLGRVSGTGYSDEDEE